MAHDAMLNAQPDPLWSHVVLTARAVRGSTLRTLAEAWSENPDRVTDLLGQLAAGLDRPAEGWDEAVIDFEVDTQMPEASVELDESQARRLAAELTEAADRTFSARSRTEQPIRLPRQQHRDAA
jgi:hypothetical protein